MEKLLKVTLDDAKQWYFGDNEILKSLALKVFTEEELTFSAQDIYNDAEKVCCELSNKYYQKLKVLDKIAVLADYYNKNASFKSSSYFIALYKGKFEIYKHESVKYPGLIYFNNIEDAEKVLNSLSETDLKILKS